MTSSDVTNQYYALLGVSYIPLIFIIIAVYDFYKLGKKIKRSTPKYGGVDYKA